MKKSIFIFSIASLTVLFSFKISQTGFANSSVAIEDVYTGTPCHPAGDLVPCSHAAHPGGDVGICQHVCMGQFGPVVCHSAGDLFPCSHPAHSMGDLAPCIHVCFP